MYKIKLVQYESKRDRHRHWKIEKITASPKKIRRIARKVGAGGVIDEKNGAFIWQYKNMPDMILTPKGIYCRNDTKVAQISAARVASILIANMLAKGRYRKWLHGTTCKTRSRVDRMDRSIGAAAQKKPTRGGQLF